MHNAPPSGGVETKVYFNQELRLANKAVKHVQLHSCVGYNPIYMVVNPYCALSAFGPPARWVRSHHWFSRRQWVRVVGFVGAARSSS